MIPFRQKFPNNPVVERNYQTSRFVKIVNENGVEFLETEFDSLQTKYEVANAGILNLLGYNYMNQGQLDEGVGKKLLDYFHSYTFELSGHTRPGPQGPHKPAQFWPPEGRHARPRASFLIRFDF